MTAFLIKKIILTAVVSIVFGLSILAYPANTRYRLTFSAYSNTGHDVTVRILKHVSPYTAYMLDLTANLGTSWQTFFTEFTSSGFTGMVNDGRLMFWLAPYAAAGDNYYIDNVILQKVTSNPADFNSDGKVNFSDLGMMMSDWNYTTKHKADINQDGIVNFVGFGIMLSYWG